MGTASTTKYIRLNTSTGNLAEEAALTTSAGSGDAQRVPALNANGILDSTIINSKTASAGASDSGKIPALNASGILDDSIMNAATTGVSKVLKTDGSGRIDITVLPVGVGADTVGIVASENLTSGDLVNIWNSGGARCRKAVASTPGIEAHGFVLANVNSGTTATVYFEGTNTALTGLTPGRQYLSTTAGLPTITPPTGAGNFIQVVGFATSATSMNFQSGTPIVLS